MASSITIPEVKRLVQKVIQQATGAKLTLTNITIHKVLQRPDDTIAAIWFTVHSINEGYLSYFIDWDSDKIYFDNVRNRELHGEIRFNGRY